MDDNQLTLPGYVDAIRGAPELELAGAFGHAMARAWTGDWCLVDVAVVDAADEESVGDQFPGVGVVRHIRAQTEGRTRPTVVVVTGHYLHDGLRHRMAEADADFFFLRSDLRSASALVDVVLHPERYRRGVAPVADPDARRALGLGPERAVDVEAFVGYVEAQGLSPMLDPDASRPDPRSRRWLRHRQGMAAAGDIEPVNLTTGTRPLDQDTPSIRQFSRLWAWAARIRRPDE